MCGRLNQQRDFFEWHRKEFGAPVPYFVNEKEFPKVKDVFLYNIAPTNYAETLYMKEGVLTATRMRFGLMPNWVKMPLKEAVRKFHGTINARSETIFNLPSFRGVVLSKRCLIPVSGYHEWPSTATPYFIKYRDDSPMLLGGIWDSWNVRDEEGKETDTWMTGMSIVTTEPGKYTSKFHDREPLILEKEDALKWINPDINDRDEISGFFNPYDSPKLTAYPVSNLVNSARYKDESVTEQIDDEVPHD